LGTGFTNTALAAVEKNIKGHTMRLCRRLAFEGRRREPVNLAKWFACFSLDVCPDLIIADGKVGGDLSLGESFDTLLKEDNRYLFDAVGKAVKLVSVVFPI
jgi:hypothetical protein